MKYLLAELTVSIGSAIWFSLILVRKWTHIVQSKRVNCDLCIPRQMNALFTCSQVHVTKESLMKIYIRIYFLTLKFIIPWTYHAREVVETPSSQLLRLHEQQIRKHSRDPSFMDLVGWWSWIWWYSWSSIFSIFVRGPKKKTWPMETL